MKKVLTIVGAALFTTLTSFGQNCTPYAPVTNGYYPPSDQIPCAINGVYYDQTISYKGHPNSVYTAYVDSITNLPPGLSVSYPIAALTPGGSWCARITGTPNAACGQYNILIYISIPQVSISGELTQLSKANPSFFFAAFGDNSNRILRVYNNNCQPLVTPQTTNYSAYPCTPPCEITSQPVTINAAKGSNAYFSASTSGISNFKWQSNASNMGWHDIPSNNQYTGTATSTLTVNDVQLANHLQPFRIIATNGSCADTSNVATINVTDTCIVIMNDTINTFISVTDTLIINTKLAGFTPPNHLNTIKVFPNPAYDHLTINYGNFASMSGYALKITNQLGQVVFTTPINQQSSYIDLTTWTGNGIYFLQLIDPQNNTIENRKIVIQ